MFLSPCHCPLSWLTCSHRWVQSCNGSLFCLVFSHTWLRTCNGSLFCLMVLYSLVYACTASSHSVEWLLQPSLYRIGTPLRLPKSLGLFLCWCSTIGLSIHLNIVMLHNKSCSEKNVSSTTPHLWTLYLHEALFRKIWTIFSGLKSLYKLYVYCKLCIDIVYFNVCIVQRTEVHLRLQKSLD